MKRLQNTSNVNDNDASGSSLPPSKRAKQDAGLDGDTVMTSYLDVGPSELASTNQLERDVPGVSTAYCRDEDYYFDDGSVVLRVEDVLFKIQASHLKIHSAVFQDMFAMPPGSSQSIPEGGSDDRPVVIPGIKPSQFRNLMKMFYSPPSDQFIESLQSYNEDSDRTLEQLKFYLDIAQLSHRFDIPEMEKWANQRVQRLVSVAAQDLALNTSEDASPEFLDALEYYQIIRDFPMAHSFRSMIQSCWNGEINIDSPEDPSLLGFIAFFKGVNLAQIDTPTFGFLFALLMRYKVTTWEGPFFTKLDRMALFSATTYLASLPLALQDGLRTPLFSKPSSGRELLGRQWRNTRHESCNDECRQIIFRKWQKRFSDNYYSNITNEGGRGVALRALTSIPYRRLRLVADISDFNCSRACLETVVESLDLDIGELFTKVASYYREIE